MHALLCFDHIMISEKKTRRPISIKCCDKKTAWNTSSWNLYSKSHISFSSRERDERKRWQSNCGFMKTTSFRKMDSVFLFCSNWYTFRPHNSIQPTWHTNENSGTTIQGRKYFYSNLWIFSRFLAEGPRDLLLRPTLQFFRRMPETLMRCGDPECQERTLPVEITISNGWCVFLRT